MAANPRKFSEKIAQHMQKQAEEEAEFQKIMKAVNEVKPTTATSQHLNTPLLNQRHGGSLPNVNQMAQQSDKGHTSRQLFNPSSTSPRGSRNSIGPVRLKQTRASDHAPYNSPPTLSSSIPSNAQSAGFSSSGLPSFFGNNYLPLPMENSTCRRFNSDSALNSMLIPSTVPHSSEESSNNSNDPYDTYLSQNQNNTGSNRTSPHLHDSPSGIRVLAGSGDGGAYLDIPQGSSPLTGSGVSAGSLPDITNFTNANYHFPSPIQQPLDMDEQQLNHSPYSTSPVTYSPSNLSSSHASPIGGGGGSSNQMVHHNQQQAQQMSHQQQQSQTPRSPNSSIHNNPLYVNIANATNNSFQQSFPQDNMMYRNPQRPSPQNSPNPYRSASPLDGQLSAPSSPSTQATLDYQQAYQLQQHFENITVADRDRNNGSWRQGANQYYYNQLQQGQGDNPSGQNQNQSPLHQQPQTPQTPSSIPDIILTEFLGSDFDVDVRSSEALEGLLREVGPLDMDGFQLLNENDPLQLDPQDEDSFRLDRL